MKFEEEILKYFPCNIYNLLKKEIDEDTKKILQEIRLRCNRPIILKSKNKDKIIDYRINQCELLQILEKICNNSIYAYKNQICNGFITVKGGHRIGITGTAIIEGEKVINLKYINGLNFRIAREVLNCCEKIINQIIDKENNTIYNTLIVSPPGKGKTTILRDIIRKISNGMPEFCFQGMNCGLVDERGEIAAMYHGIPQNDIGIRTDVIENISKAQGIKMLIRSMAPEIIACDEIGSIDDVEAIKQALLCRSKRYIYNASEKK